jgi:hypothetical protein
MRSWKDFLVAYAFVYVWCAIVAWDMNPAEWSEITRLVWMIMGFVVFSMVHNERKKNEQ